MRVGFIGLGSMGRPMAQRMQARGHDLVLYDRLPAALEWFAGTGATIAATPAEVGGQVDAVGICVFDAAGVDEVLFGPEGLTETLRPGAVVLVHSTVSPPQIRAIAARAAAHRLPVLDAPVIGGGPRALTGTLTMTVGGDAASLAQVADLLAALSDQVVHLGEVGTASQAKLIHNTLFAAQITLADDALRAGASLGVDPDGLAVVLATGSAACVASGVRLRAGSLAAIAGTPSGPTLAKDVDLMADQLGDAPGSTLVDIANRFVTAMHPG
jgi:3-hydroxyisobutyrate dehydrogenase